jgi:hypothetical protein
MRRNLHSLAALLPLVSQNEACELPAKITPKTKTSILKVYVKPNFSPAVEIQQKLIIQY